MAALTCHRNPQNKKETFAFYTTSDNQVGYEIHQESELDKLRGGGDSFAGAPDNDLSRAPGDQPVTGLVRHPGAFSALEFQKRLCVFGIRKDGVISELSPAVRDLPNIISTKRGGLAGCGDGGDFAWLYYISSGETPQIKQYRLAVGTDKIMRSGSPTPSADTFLAAYYKPAEVPGAGLRGVVYQDSSSNKLKYLEIGQDEQASGGEIANTTQASKTTPLATCVRGDTVYLYFVNDDGNLLRVEKKGQGSWTNQIAETTNDWSLNPLWATLSLNEQYIIVRQQFENPSRGYKYLQWPDVRVPQD